MSDTLPLLPLVLDNVSLGLRRALGQEGVPFVALEDGPPRGRFLLYDSRGRRRRNNPAAGQTAIDVDQLRWPPFTNTAVAGSAVLNADPFAALTDEKPARFRWRIAGIEVSEEVSRFDKREIRRELMARLRRVIEEHGGVWLRAAAFPFPYRSAFNFRIDYEEFEQSDFDAVHDAVAGHEDATSHFINAASFPAAGDVWRRFQGLDVGSHGYWHHTYRTVEENLQNIRRGIEAIESHGLATSGFVAPMGRFYPALHSALTKLNVSHSSEFGLAYDDLPFTVGENGPLQIPIHPICLGLFLDAARSRQSTDAAEKGRLLAAVGAAREHLIAVARRRYRAGEPIFLYGHPSGRLGRYPHVLRDVFAAVDEFGAVWQTTLTQFAAWWRARRAVELSVSRRGEQFVVSAKNLPKDYPFGVEYFRQRHVALMPLDGPSLSFSPAALAYENRDTIRVFRPARPDRTQGIKGGIRRLIDWERITPIEEIRAVNWQNRAKRALRRLLRA